MSQQQQQGQTNQTREIQDQEEVVLQQNELIGQLREKVRVLISEEQRLKKYIEQQDRKLRDSGIQELSQKVQELTAAVMDRDSQIESLQQGNENLSQVIEKLQQNEGQIARQYDAEIKKLRMQVQQQKETIENLKNMEIENKELQEKNQSTAKELESVVLKQKQDEVDLLRAREELATLQRSMRLYNSETLIDKRVISNLLIQYFDHQALLDKKIQILETMASMLNFSESDHEKLGLRKQLLKNQLQRQNSNQYNSDSGKKEKSISQAFIEFLSGRDDSDEENDQQQSKAGEIDTQVEQN